MTSGDYGIKVQVGDWIWLTKRDGICYPGKWRWVKDTNTQRGVIPPIPNALIEMTRDELISFEGWDGQVAPNWEYIIQQLYCEGAL